MDENVIIMRKDLRCLGVSCFCDLIMSTYLQPTSEKLISVHGIYLSDSGRFLV